jgi:hypothetical protein
MAMSILDGDNANRASAISRVISVSLLACSLIIALILVVGAGSKEGDASMLISKIVSHEAELQSKEKM